MLRGTNILLAGIVTISMTASTHASSIYGGQTQGHDPAFTHPGKLEKCSIAVIDTGIDYTHSKLERFVWRNPSEIPGHFDNDNNGYPGDIHGWDFEEFDAFPYDSLFAIIMKKGTPRIAMDPYGESCEYSDSFKNGQNMIYPGSGGHGTHVSGIAINRSGAPVMPLRVNFHSPDWLVQVRKSIEYAIDNGARIINMSFGAYRKNLSKAELMEMSQIETIMAKHPNILFVAAAGNENIDLSVEKPVILPGGIKTVRNLITVGAIDGKGKLASFSNAGQGVVDVYAPGVNINSTFPGNAMAVKSGTSMAAPYIAGMAAVVCRKNPAASGEAIKRIIMKNARQKNLEFTKTTYSSDITAGTKIVFKARIVGP